MQLGDWSQISLCSTPLISSILTLVDPVDLLAFYCCLSLMQDRCPIWAQDGECSRNMDYMMISCKLSCNNCKLYSIKKPFRVVQLNSGYSMPAVGFGTAGLGIGTAAAVQFAALAGYKMFDSAEVSSATPPVMHSTISYKISCIQITH